MQCFCFVFIFVAQLLYKQQKCERVRDYSVQQVSLSFQYKRPKCHVSACFSQCSLEDSLPVCACIIIIASFQSAKQKCAHANSPTDTVNDRHRGERKCPSL